jgi:hypothetical protein
MKLPPELFLAAFAVSGVTLKTSDFLGEREKTPLSVLSAVTSSLVFGVLMSESVFSSSLILGLFIGVTLSRKVDRPNLVLGLILTFAFAFLFEVKTPTPWLVIVVTSFTFIDEWGHEQLSRKEGIAALFFRYRLTLKLVMSLLTLISHVQALHLMGFLCFDLSYDITNLILKKYVEVEAS